MMKELLADFCDELGCFWLISFKYDFSLLDTYRQNNGVKDGETLHAIRGSKNTRNKHIDAETMGKRRKNKDSQDSGRTQKSARERNKKNTRPEKTHHHEMRDICESLLTETGGERRPRQTNCSPKKICGATSMDNSGRINRHRLRTAGGTKRTKKAIRLRDKREGGYRPHNA